MEKECNVCHIVKSIDEFHQKKTGLFGVSELCKECKKEKDKSRWLTVSIKEKERRSEYSKRYYINNIDKFFIKNRIKNDSTRKRNNEYKKRRRSDSEIIKLIESTRTRVNKYLKKSGYDKNMRTFEIVGIAPEKLKDHISNQFKDGMDWTNYGEWHIDHIVPLSSAKSESELYKLFHYTNLQPLWAFDNLSKGNKIIG